ncbi:MAG TPA: HAD-IIA family hydrolase [Gemmatimonadaceae bacterium]|jgi:glycerol-1-phosphatase|nr:HAD-IIA family hydrolase [Gemmatimonadaceae bacterium]
MARDAHPTPLDSADVILSDLDGVVYRGAAPIPHAVTALNAARETKTVGFLTNNASRLAADVAEQLTTMGLDVDADDVVTSPQATLLLLSRVVEPGTSLLVVGGPGLTTVLQGAGYRLVRTADEHPDAVVQGFSPHVSWNDLAEAAYALASGIPWVATNLDTALPLERGLAPGNGAIVAAVRAVVNREPLVAGKPEEAIFDAARERFPGSRWLFIGDQVDTDIRGANRSGMSSALVFTGISQPQDAFAAHPDARPDFILRDLRDLTLPYPPIRLTRNGKFLKSAAADAVVAADGRRVRLVATGEEPMNVIRATAALIWEHAATFDSLELDTELHDAIIAALR